MAMDRGRGRQVQRQLEQVLSRASTDATFRQELVSNPRATLSKELGAGLRDNVDVRVLEDTADAVHLVLPAARGTGQVSDEDLRSMAGGAGTCRCWQLSAMATW